jgi:hypothetical protein
MFGSSRMKVCWLILAAVLVVALLPLDGSVTLALDESAMDICDILLQESTVSLLVPSPPRIEHIPDPVLPDRDVSFLPFRPPA